MYVKDKIIGVGLVGIIWRDGLYLIVMLCSSVLMEHEDYRKILDF
jgi:hypothetical protein